MALLLLFSNVHKKATFMKYIYSLNELPKDKYILSGGKASSLANMIQNTHIRVPEGYVILSDAFDGFELKFSPFEYLIIISEIL